MIVLTLLFKWLSVWWFHSSENAFRRPVDQTSRQGGGKRGNHHNSQRTTTPQKIENRRNRQGREDCFSAPVDTFLDDDFDFEKNLALFDKRAVLREIEGTGGSSSPVRGGPDPRQPAKYKHDENVLNSGPVVYRRIQVNGEKVSAQEYVTDSGLVVPCISYSGITSHIHVFQTDFSVSAELSN